jgi:hypothetical protein
MKTRSFIVTLAMLLGSFGLNTVTSALAAGSSPCTGPNGSRFNLEPRPNAVVQAAESVAVLPDRAGLGLDLVVATATDERGLAGSPDEFYVQRSSGNCKADFEGGLPLISNIIDQFAPFGTPIAVADPVRDAFFIADIRFGLTTDDNGVGILRASAANLLNTTACPNGTQVNGSAACFNTGSVFNITTLNAFLSSPHIAVDPRISGTGAGDVYAVVTQADPNNTLHTSIFLMACRNVDLNCSNSIKISGGEVEADFAWVQVRPDGGITVSYRNTKFPGVNPEDIKFVNCTANGAPTPPTCAAPVLVTTEKTPIFASSMGDVPMDDVLYPKHAHRLESDGTTVTTFLIYDRCEARVINFGFVSDFCPKTDVAITSSADGGHTWAPVASVTSSQGQQFFGAIATDSSTGTVNIGYYSTENDPFQQRPQIFLAQIAPGTTVVGKPHLLTSAFADAQASSPVIVLLEPTGFGNRIGLAAAGTGTAGQSRAYITFTWNSVFGTYGSVTMPEMNNHLTLLQY